MISLISSFLFGIGLLGMIGLWYKRRDTGFEEIVEAGSNRKKIKETITEKAIKKDASPTSEKPASAKKVKKKNKKKKPKK